MNNHADTVPFHARDEEELLTLDDVAEILMASPNTVRWWRQQGTGPDFFKIGRRLYTTVGDLRAFIRKQRLATQPVIDRPKVV
ncbi:helix-turn-helix domain-containing protein [Nocardioides sp. BGMRC 2183]|nr:helix-turn-helix domain-containing protein [Nocardioides sp. BGMRC 2183]